MVLLEWRYRAVLSVVDPPTTAPNNPTLSRLISVRSYISQHVRSNADTLPYASGRRLGNAHATQRHRSCAPGGGCTGPSRTQLSGPRPLTSSEVYAKPDPADSVTAGSAGLLRRGCCPGRRLAAFSRSGHSCPW